MRLAAWISLGLLGLVMLLAGAWCSLAIWYRCGFDEPLRSLSSGGAAAFSVVAVSCLATRRRWIACTAYAGADALILVWWATISPANDRNWSPDVARTMTAAIEGDRLLINNVRNFNWRTETDFDAIWEQRTYNLSEVTDVDLIMSYWMGEAIAHTLVSFGFRDGSRLAFSIEIRRERTEKFSAIAGFFRQYELAIVAGDERDLIRLRSNVRGEDVRIYRTRMAPGDARRLLLAYLQEANDLGRTPQFYNTLTSNCTTLVFEMVRVIHPGLQLDPRVILSGYLPDYAYDYGALDTSIPFEKLRTLSHIHDAAVRADRNPDFSRQIRAEVPSPR